MRCLGVFGQVCLHTLLMLEGSASRIVKAPRELRGAVKLAASVRASSVLHEVCSSCPGAGAMDPFQATFDYCTKNYNLCKCCQGKLEDAKLQICTQGKEGTTLTFMGYGTCVKGIEVAIEEKKQQCKHQQAISDYANSANKEIVNDALGERSPFYEGFMIMGAHKTNLTGTHLQNSSGYVERRFASECATYSDPSCSSFDALCKFDYGCNYQLQTAESEYTSVKSWYDLYKATPCYSR
eukprot:TRINITY_DN11954_c0_g1_i1.p1 TRINITY_DN11954_c0_g1~~TRINITY_DN11954_c0_g1_i1.p1  ORF type:complete len:238 (-),score=44.10 TRINITY_DN11954_c0_g1_i1:95-808(-)